MIKLLALQEQTIKIKRKTRTIYKKHDGELYIFKNAIAKIPGMWHKNPRKPYTITSKEFAELTA